MSTLKPLHEEIINEIGTQTLARLGLNIFSLNTYASYGASVLATNDTLRAYDRHKNNDKYYGQTFEELDIGQANIKDALLNTGNKTYTTNTLVDIQKVQNMIRDNKKPETLDSDDKKKYDYIIANYSDEVKNMSFFRENSNLNLLVTTALKTRGNNHPTTDTVTLDENGKVIKTAQLKVRKKTNDLLKERYLTDKKDDKDAVDELRVPFDDYVRHKQNFEKKIQETTRFLQNKQKELTKAQEKNNVQKIEKLENTIKQHKETITKNTKALQKLNANNTCNRLMAENPRAIAVATQSIAASGHIAQAGFSDAIVVVLSILVNGIIWEVKDACEKRNECETSIIERIKRLLNKALESFKNTFRRGAIFGAIDVAIGIIGQIFQSIAGSLKQLWGQLRTSAKSIYNAIYSYINNEIKTTKDLLSTILKSLFSAAWIVGAIGLEKQLEAALLSIMPPLAPFVAPILAIMAGAFAVVMTHRSIDMALDVLFGAMATRDMAKMRAEEITELVVSKIPALMEETKQLEEIIACTHQERMMSLESSFGDYKTAFNNGDFQSCMFAIDKINDTWGIEVATRNFEESHEILEQLTSNGRLEC